MMGLPSLLAVLALSAGLLAAVPGVEARAATTLPTGARSLESVNDTIRPVVPAL